MLQQQCKTSYNNEGIFTGIKMGEVREGRGLYFLKAKLRAAGKSEVFIHTTELISGINTLTFDMISIHCITLHSCSVLLSEVSNCRGVSYDSVLAVGSREK